MATTSSIYDGMLRGIQNHWDNMLRLQEQIASGSRVNRASDSPTDAFQIMHLSSSSFELGTYIKNLWGVAGDLGGAYTGLEGITTLLNTQEGGIIALVQQVVSGTYTSENRAMAAVGINESLNEVVRLANIETAGRYHFSGDKTGVIPFEIQRKDGNITAVSYQGGENQLFVPIAPGTEQSATFVGSEVFQARGVSSPEFAGS